MTPGQQTIPELQRGAKEVKCVVWDLDNTVWDGVLLEPGPVELKPGIRDIVEELDRRGILHSIASRNDRELALGQLRTFGLDEYFLAPEIGWNAKSISIKRIQETLNLGLESFLFIDDQPFEIAEVGTSLPEVRCLDASRYRDLPAVPALNPRFVTEDSARRRMLYREQLVRQQAETAYQGPREEFLASLGMDLTIAHATEEDLRRAEELTVRTNQLNATGRTYSYDELRGLLAAPEFELFTCELSDRYGSHGKIGLALVEHSATHLYLRLLLVSCRIMSHGVGSVLLSFVLQRAQSLGKELLADFVDTGRNRMMMVTYRFSGFQILGKEPDGHMRMSHDMISIPPFPAYMKVRCPSLTRRTSSGS